MKPSKCRIHDNWNVALGRLTVKLSLFVIIATYNYTSWTAITSPYIRYPAHNLCITVNIALALHWTLLCAFFLNQLYFPIWTAPCIKRFPVKCRHDHHSLGPPRCAITYCQKHLSDWETKRQTVSLVQSQRVTFKGSFWHTIQWRLDHFGMAIKHICSRRRPVESQNIVNCAFHAHTNVYIYLTIWYWETNILWGPKPSGLHWIITVRN